MKSSRNNSFLCLYCQMQSLEKEVYAERYSLYLNSRNGQNSDDGTHLVPTIVMRNASSIILQVSLLYRRLWTYTVLAHGCNEHMVMGDTHLSNLTMHINFLCTFVRTSRRRAFALLVSLEYHYSTT